MNIFTDRIFEDFDECEFYYDISRDKHSESIYLVFYHFNEDDVDPDYEKKYVLTKDAAVLSEWLRLFGYENNEDEVFSLLDEAKKLSDIFQIDKNRSVEEIDGYLHEIDKESFDETVSHFFALLKPAIERCPMMACFYSAGFAILSSMYYKLSHPDETEIISKSLRSTYYNLEEHLANLENIYHETRKYCKAVFQVDNSVGSEVSPKTISYIYKDYCIETKTRYYKEKPLLTSSGEYIGAEDLELDPQTVPWEIYYKNKKESSAFDDEGESYMQKISIEDIAYAGINYLMESDSVLRTCKLCGKTFRIKYTSSQEYCTRPYGDVKTPCNEYASRKNYKEKLFKHPIHQEFTKSYNKLYGRIRRGKIPADTPLMEQLKRLHEDYYEKYENTHFKEREAVWKEYIEKNKELLA